MDDERAGLCGDTEGIVIWCGLGLMAVAVSIQSFAVP
jgi:hypothetical protein